MLTDALTAVTQAGVLGFVVASMISMGLGLTVAQVVAPLRDVRLVGFLLVANFAVLPLAAIAITRVLPLEPSAATAIVIYGCCAGAPFLPKLAQMAKGDVAVAVGSMVLLMVVTVAFAPIVLPLAVSGASVDAGQIAASLVLFMLLPLGAALGIRARYPDVGRQWAGPAGQVSTAALLIGVAAGLFVSWRDILAAIGSWIFIGTAVLGVVALGAGWLAGAGRLRPMRTVTTLGTAQRNISAALVVAGSLGGDVVVMTLVAGLSLVVALIVLAGEVGRRAAGVAEAAEA